MQVALILGGGNCVFSDIEKACSLFEPACILAVNDILVEFPNVNHVCSMHPEKMELWLQRRRENGYPDPEAFWTAGDRLKRCPFPFRHIRNTRGGSGLLAVYVARYLGFKKIVLAGIPMDKEFEHFHTPGKWHECKLYRTVWEKDVSLFTDVRSFSGWTGERFGPPTLDWLIEH